MKHRAITFEKDDAVVVASLRQAGLWGAIEKKLRERPDTCGLAQWFCQAENALWVFQSYQGVPGDEGYVLTKIPGELLDTPMANLVLGAIALSLHVTPECLDDATLCPVVPPNN